MRIFRLRDAFIVAAASMSFMVPFFLGHGNRLFAFNRAQVASTRP